MTGSVLFGYAKSTASLFDPTYNKFELADCRFGVNFNMRMKTLRSTGFFGAALFVLFLAGCDTPTARIHSNPGAFAQLPPDQQSLVQQGKVAVGFTADAVRLALGAPDRVTVRRSSTAQSEVWHYFDFDLVTAPYPLYYNFYSPGWGGIGGYGYGRGGGGYGYGRGGGGWGGWGYGGGWALLNTDSYRRWYERVRVTLVNNRVTAVRYDSH
jgi:hypothetical protein